MLIFNLKTIDKGFIPYKLNWLSIRENCEKNIAEIQENNFTTLDICYTPPLQVLSEAKTPYVALSELGIFNNPRMSCNQR